MAQAGRPTSGSLLAAFRTRGSARFLAAMLCVLALAFNLLGAIAAAEARAGTGDTQDIAVCHFGGEATPAQPAPANEATPDGKCPLCLVSAAALFAPPMPAPPTVAASPAASSDAPPNSQTAVLPPLPLTTRPSPRAPPLPA